MSSQTHFARYQVVALSLAFLGLGCTNSDPAISSPSESPGVPRQAMKVTFEDGQVIFGAYAARVEAFVRSSGAAFYSVKFGANGSSANWAANIDNYPVPFPAQFAIGTQPFLGATFGGESVVAESGFLTVALHHGQISGRFEGLPQRMRASFQGEVYFMCHLEIPPCTAETTGCVVDGPGFEGTVHYSDVPLETAGCEDVLALSKL